MLAREGGGGARSSITPARGIYVREFAQRRKFTLLSIGVPTGDVAAARPRRDRARPQRQRHRSSRCRRTASGSRSRSGSGPSSRRSRAPAAPVDIGPATQAYPVQRVSRDAGFFLHWSGDSRKRLLDARSGAVLARPGRHVRVRRQRRPGTRRPTSRKRRASPSASPSRATSRRDRSRSSAPA